MLIKSGAYSNTSRSVAVLTIVTLGIASTISSCSSGSSGGAPPVATITFPPPISSTDAATLTVTGTASDETGVAMVEVDGVGVTSTSGNFANWRVIVPLTPGVTNLLTVSTVDSLGIRDDSAAEVTVHVAADVSGNGAQFTNGYAVALDGDRAYVTDFDADELVRVDLTNGNDVIISDAQTGAGPVFIGAGGLALTDGLTTALVANWQPDELLSVDLVSGNRTAIGDVNNVLFGPIGIALIDDTLAVVTNNATDEVLSVDLVNGNPTVLSAFGTQGSGPGFIGPEGVAIDPANNRALVTDSLANALVAVNLNNGNRAVVSDATTGNGPAFDVPIGIVVDAARNRALVANNNQDQLLAVDLATGNRTVFSDASGGAGTGPVLSLVSGIALDGADTAYVSGEKLWAVELVSGDRVIVGQ